MKRILFALLPLMAVNAHAVSDDGQKIAVVKKVFDNLENRSAIIKRNATSDLRHAVIHGDKTIGGYHSCTPWEIVGGGQDWDDTEVRRSARYRVMGNIVNVKYSAFGGYSESESVTYHLKKVNGKYLIDDIINNGTSLKNTALERMECFG